MKKEIKIGDEFDATFTKNEKGIKPITRIKGIICFIDSKCEERVKIGSTHIVRVTEVNEKHLVIEPLVMLKSREENEEIIKEKLKQFQVPRTGRVKAKKGFRYCTKQELQKE